MDIGEILIAMGMAPSMAGFHEMIAAVEEYQTNHTVIQGDVCETLAKKFGTNSANIYRRLHYAVNKINPDTDVYREYIGNNRVPLSEFTSILGYRTMEKGKNND
jgi:hypothetical protein